MKKFKIAVLVTFFVLGNIITLPIQLISCLIFKLTKQADKMVLQAYDDAEFVEGKLDELCYYYGKDVSITEAQFERIVNAITERLIERADKFVLGQYSAINWLASVPGTKTIKEINDTLRMTYEDISRAALYTSGTRFRVIE